MVHPRTGCFRSPPMARRRCSRPLHSTSMRVTTSGIIIHAPRDVVWQVLTDPLYVRQWQYNSVLTTDWVVGEPIRFSAEWQGQAFEQWGTVLDFEAPTRLGYSLFAPRPGVEDVAQNYFTMTYELSDEPSGTSVTFTHQDPRESAGAEVESEDEIPVLVALKSVAESLGKSDR
jgi:uncharacterized protein YndB with AHSA1/START domain